MSRHRRLQKTMRSPQREARTWRSRLSRQVRRALRDHFADGHVHDGHDRCMPGGVGLGAQPALWLDEKLPAPRQAPHREEARR